MASTILVIDPNRDFCREMELFFSRRGHQVLTVPGAEQAMAILNEQPVALVITELRLPKMSGVDLIRLLRREPGLSRIPLLVISTQGKPAQMSDAYKAGADDYLIKPVELSIVQAKVDLLLHRAQLQQLELSQSWGKVIPFFSAKGGSGRSTILANLSGLLTSQFSKRTVIVDLNLDFPGLAPLLNLRPTSAVKDISEEMVRTISNDDLQQFLVTHESGLHLLPGTLDAFEAELVSIRVVEIILRRLREIYEFIFIDMAPRYSPLSMAIFEQADYICLTFATQLASLVVTRHARDVLVKSQIPSQKILMLANRTQPGAGISEGQLMEIFGDALIGSIPYTPVLEDIENRGGLVYQLYPRAPLRKVLEELAFRLIELPAPKRPQQTPIVLSSQEEGAPSKNTSIRMIGAQATPSFRLGEPTTGSFAKSSYNAEAAAWIGSSGPLDLSSRFNNWGARDIFILDSERVTTTRLEHLFTYHNYNPRVLANSTDTLHLYQQGQGLALVISLDQLSQPSGYELYQAIINGRNSKKPFYLIILGTQEEINLARKEELQGAFLTKPINPKDLADIVDVWNTSS